MRGGKKATYSKKQQRRNSKQYARSNSSRASTAQPEVSSDTTSDSNEEYFIKLGEGIVLDWHDEAFDALFGGDDSDDMRGHSTSENIPVVDDPSIREKYDLLRSYANNGISMDQCFSDTCKTEILNEDNAWFCSHCKERRRAHKTLEIWTAPDILVVHLKRFSRSAAGFKKLNLFVDFPLENLDMNSRILNKEDGKDYTYDLFAIDNHSGITSGGHYTAYAKNFFDGQWHKFNDTFVTSVSNLQEMVHGNAYLLFYRRRSSQPLGPPELQELVNNARNPTHSESDSDDSSGEGKRLGDQSSASSRQLGPLSAGTAEAGAVTGTRLQKDDAGPGREASPAARLRQSSEEGDEGYLSGAQDDQDQTWSWDGIVGDINDVDNTSDGPEVGSDDDDGVGHTYMDDLNEDDDGSVRDITLDSDFSGWERDVVE
jgi:ubiquitin carboxyl-terminal hydrolase 4/11/15